MRKAVSYGGLVVKHPVFGAKGHRFETFPEINFLAHNIVGGWPR